MKKKEGLVMNVGSASIILVLLVFVLSMFGVLSIKASNHELRLAEKLGSSVEEYYEIDALGQLVLAKVDHIITQAREHNKNDVFLKETTGKVKAIEGKLGNGKIENMVIENESRNLKKISYEVAISEKRTLMVGLSFNERNQYTIDKWSVKQETLGQYELQEIDEMEGIDLENDNMETIPEGGKLWDGVIDSSDIEE